MPECMAELTIFWRFWRLDPFSASAQLSSSAQTSDRCIGMRGEKDTLAHPLNTSNTKATTGSDLADVAVSVGVAEVELQSTSVNLSVEHIFVNACVLVSE